MTAETVFTTDRAGIQHWTTWKVGSRTLRSGGEFTPHGGPRLIFDEVTYHPADNIDHPPTVHAHRFRRFGARVDVTLPAGNLDTATIHRTRELQP